MALGEPAPGQQANAEQHPEAFPEAQARLAALAGRPSRVLITGLFSASEPAGSFERALRRLGHSVVSVSSTFDEAEAAVWTQALSTMRWCSSEEAKLYAEVLQRRAHAADIVVPSGPLSLGTITEQFPAGWQPELFIWFDAFEECRPDVLQPVLPEGCTTVAVLPDTHTGRHEWQIQEAQRYDYVFIQSRRSDVSVFREAGCKQVHWLPSACDPKVHRRLGWVTPLWDVVHAGNTDPAVHQDRIALLESLQDRGVDLKLVHASPEDRTLALNRGRIVLNRSLDGELGDAIIEILASGACLLTDRLPPEAGMDELGLVEGEHYLAYDDPGECFEQIQRLLSTDAAQRRSVAVAGRRLVRRWHTYRDRAQALVATVLSAGAVSASPQVEAWPPAHRRLAASGGIASIGDVAAALDDLSSELRQVASTAPPAFTAPPATPQIPASPEVSASSTQLPAVPPIAPISLVPEAVAPPTSPSPPDVSPPQATPWPPGTATPDTTAAVQPAAEAEPGLTIPLKIVTPEVPEVPEAPGAAPTAHGQPSIVEADDGKGEGLLSEAHRLLELDDLAGAAARFVEAREALSDPSIADYFLGNVRLQQGQLAEAIRNLELAAEAHPEIADYANALGAAYQEGRQYDEAEQAYRRALETAPDHADARLNIADPYRETEREAEAIPLYEALLRDEPGDIEAMKGLAASLAAQGGVPSSSESSGES